MERLSVLTLSKAFPEILQVGYLLSWADNFKGIYIHLISFLALFAKWTF